jgi:hypothetical protein
LFNVTPVFPLTAVTRYKLSGAVTGQSETELLSFTKAEGTAGVTVTLTEGYWNFTLNAYKGAEESDLYLQSKVLDKGIATAANSVTFSLLPLNSVSGTGVTGVRHY